MGTIEQLILDVRAWLHLLMDGVELRPRSATPGRRTAGARHGPTTVGHPAGHQPDAGGLTRSPRAHGRPAAARRLGA